MTLNADNIKKNNEDDLSCCCFVIDSLQEWWNVNKYRVSTPLAVGLSVCGGIGSILVGKSIIGASIMIGVTNVGIFFSGIALSAFSSENKKLSKDNISLCNEKNDIVRRLTMAYPHLNHSELASEKSDDSVEPINFEQVHKNNIFQSSIRSFNFPDDQ